MVDGDIDWRTTTAATLVMAWPMATVATTWGWIQDDEDSCGSETRWGCREWHSRTGRRDLGSGFHPAPRAEEGTSSGDGDDWQTWADLGSKGEGVGADAQDRGRARPPRRAGWTRGGGRRGRGANAGLERRTRGYKGRTRGRDPKRRTNY
jgi:hypothetical protein